MKKCLFMFLLLVITLVTAALTDGGKTDNDVNVGDQYAENTLVDQKTTLETLESK